MDQHVEFLLVFPDAYRIAVRVGNQTPDPVPEAWAGNLHRVQTTEASAWIHGTGCGLFRVTTSAASSPSLVAFKPLKLSLASK